jgi:4a-hydroxytetrahydrobiopterin dehydratase
MVTELTTDERETALRGLPSWRYDEKRLALHREVRFETFVQAFAAMTQIALLAEKADHHPEWSNVYNRLDVWLTTHDADGVSERDIALASAIDRIVN